MEFRFFRWTVMFVLLLGLLKSAMAQMNTTTVAPTTDATTVSNTTTVAPTNNATTMTSTTNATTVSSTTNATTVAPTTNATTVTPTTNATTVTPTTNATIVTPTTNATTVTPTTNATTVTPTTNATTVTPTTNATTVTPTTNATTVTPTTNATTVTPTTNATTVTPTTNATTVTPTTNVTTVTPTTNATTVTPTTNATTVTQTTSATTVTPTTNTTTVTPTTNTTTVTQTMSATTLTPSTNATTVTPTTNTTTVTPTTNATTMSPTTNATTMTPTTNATTLAPTSNATTVTQTTNATTVTPITNSTTVTTTTNATTVTPTTNATTVTATTNATTVTTKTNATTVTPTTNATTVTPTTNATTMTQSTNATTVTPTTNVTTVTPTTNATTITPTTNATTVTPTTNATTETPTTNATIVTPTTNATTMTQSTNATTVTPTTNATTVTPTTNATTMTQSTNATTVTPTTNAATVTPTTNATTVTPTTNATTVTPTTNATTVTLKTNATTVTPTTNATTVTPTTNATTVTPTTNATTVTPTTNATTVTLTTNATTVTPTTNATTVTPTTNATTVTPTTNATTVTPTTNATTVTPTTNATTVTPTTNVTTVTPTTNATTVTPTTNATTVTPTTNATTVTPTTNATTVTPTTNATTVTPTTNATTVTPTTNATTVTPTTNATTVTPTTNATTVTPTTNATTITPTTNATTVTPTTNATTVTPTTNATTMTPTTNATTITQTTNATTLAPTSNATTVTPTTNATTVTPTTNATTVTPTTNATTVTPTTNATTVTPTTNATTVTPTTNATTVTPTTNATTVTPTTNATTVTPTTNATTVTPTTIATTVTPTTNATTVTPTTNATTVTPTTNATTVTPTTNATTVTPITNATTVTPTTNATTVTPTKNATTVTPTTNATTVTPTTIATTVTPTTNATTVTPTTNATTVTPTTNATTVTPTTNATTVTPTTNATTVTPTTNATTVTPTTNTTTMTPTTNATTVTPTTNATTVTATTNATTVTTSTTPAPTTTNTTPAPTTTSTTTAQTTTSTTTAPTTTSTTTVPTTTSTTTAPTTIGTTTAPTTISTTTAPTTTSTTTAQTTTSTTTAPTTTSTTTAPTTTSTTTAPTTTSTTTAPTTTSTTTAPTTTSTTTAPTTTSTTTAPTTTSTTTAPTTTSTTPAPTTTSTTPAPTTTSTTTAPTTTSTTTAPTTTSAPPAPTTISTTPAPTATSTTPAPATTSTTTAQTTTSTTPAPTTTSTTPAPTTTSTTTVPTTTITTPTPTTTSTTTVPTTTITTPAPTTTSTTTAPTTTSTTTAPTTTSTTTAPTTTSTTSIPTTTTDVNECEDSNLNTCDSEATCTNTVGSFQCECNVGYSGTGLECADVDECETENECDENADCTNTVGSYTCTCSTGYVGNGRTCTDVDECQTENECDENADCANTVGSYTCACSTGYVGNGRTCTVAASLPMPFGSNENHLQFQVTDQDECLQVEDLECGLYVNDTLYDSFYICENGIAAFNRAYRSGSIPQSATSSEFSTFTDSLPLAPYWSNIDARNSQGNIFYKVYNADSLGETGNAGVHNIARGFLDTAGYTTTDINLIVVVTWENVVEYGGSVSNKASFQMILVSDGASTTFAFFAYLAGVMNFESGENFVGFSTGTSMSSLNFRVSNPVQEFVNLGRSGFFMLNLNSGDDLPLTECRECEIWAAEQASSSAQSGHVENWGAMPDCLCSRGNIDVTNAFTLLDSEFFLSSESLCYGLRSSNTFGVHRGSICCYNNNSYIPQSPNAGFKTIWNPLVNKYKTSYRNSDHLMKQKCCNSGLCGLFYTYRPINNQCSDSANVSLGGGTGDPHIRTLDGKQYTFNGHGEYILMELDDGDFSIQGRMEPYLNDQNVSVGATIFTAFAGEDKANGGKFMISLNRDKTGLEVLINNQFPSFADGSTSFSTGGAISVDKRGDNKLVVYFDRGVSVTIEYKVGGLLTVSITLPGVFKGQTKGLMGNSNGDSTDDFVARNGTSYGTNPTDQQLHEMGQTWLVTSDAMSVFDYPLGATYLDYQNLDSPVNFLDQADPSKVKDARELCGEDNLPCIFDFVFTGLDSIASETKASVNEQEDTADIIQNVAPSISIDPADILDQAGIVNVTLGQVTEIKVNGQDEGGINYRVASGLNVAKLGVPDSNNAITVTLNITNVNQTEEVSIVGIDDKDVESPTLVIQIKLCTGCGGRGTCDFNTARPGQTGQSWVVTKCNCNPYYQGPDCEEDFKGCFDTPCSLGRTCEDNNATTHETTGNAFTCSGCPHGYGEDGEGNCEDLNECDSEALNDCEDLCENTEGSYTCDCSTGYRASSNISCKDINECEEASHDCVHVCVNTEGGYNCSCYPSYIYNQTENTCTVDAVGLCGNASCPTENGGCYIEEETAVCFCYSGYMLQDDECKNINECDQNVCSQTCVDTDGSYTCGCYPGYIINADKTTCSACPGGFWGEGCNNECGCSSLGTHTCDNVKGCVCNDQWAGTRCGADVDECSDPNICGDIDKVCVNTPGAYRCECRTGYQLNGLTGQCEDANECENPSINNCEQLCINTNGGFSCDCDAGYRKVTTGDGNTCLDIDECASGDTGCSQKCSNAEGSYRCLCYYGYGLNESDRKTCDKISAEDLCNDEGLTCAGYCIVGASSASCECSQGYILGSDLQSCLDVDECSNDTLNLCSVKDNCLNTVGAYQCSCPVGFKLENDGRICTACDSFHYGASCAEECNCGVGAETCDSVTGCVCRDGWTGPRCNIDKNECDVTPSPCTTDHSECVNSPGTFTCECLTGFVLQSDGTCQDVDECAAEQTTNCNQLCDNTIGSYVCSCRPGYKTSGNSCQDIDECTTVNDCDQECINTDGSYKCSCNDGFRLDTDTRKSCLPEDQCDASQEENCDSISTQCAVIDGNPTCLCKKGFHQPNVTHCEDINECGAGVCEQRCFNVDGGYTCSCDPGYKLNNDLSTCLACSFWTYGTGCTNNCTCDRTNTQTCNPANGTCTCFGGWEGGNCTTDIDECTETTDGCPDDSTCQNTDGGFVCECDEGFFKDAEGNCTGCSSTTYGINCGNKCTCAPANTDSCNPQNGTCTCLSVWKGDNCTEDVDECDDDPTPCTVSLRTQCTNTVGGFKCGCDSGYELVDDTCVDKDECLRGESTCEQKCINTIGGFQCSCNPGYFGAENNCTVCENGTWGDNCTQTCVCTADQFTSCDAETGCVCKPEYTGQTCADDVDECTAVKNACPANSNCNNSVGSHTCVCLTGYISGTSTTGQSTCDACDNNTYGLNCTEPCDCIAANTFYPQQSCDHVTGSCDCKWQWNGTRCELDVDECIEGTDTCTHSNETCLNIDGGYKCVCVVGYLRNSNDICIVENVTQPAAGNDTHTAVHLVLVLDIAIPADVNINNADTNAQYIQELQNSLQAILDAEANGATVTVISAREGSIIVEMSVLVPQESAPAFGQVTADIASGKEIPVFNQTGQAINMTINGVEVPVGNTTDQCTVFLTAAGPCPQKSRCEIFEGNPSCRSITAEDITPLIIGLGLGIPLFIISIVLIAVVVLYYRKSMDKRLAEDITQKDDRYSMDRGVFTRELPTKLNTSEYVGPYDGGYKYSYPNWYDPFDKTTETDVQSPSRHTWNFPQSQTFQSDIDPARQFKIKRPHFSAQSYGGQNM